MDWQSISEVVTGMALEKRIPIQAIRPELLYPPYDSIITDLKNGKTLQEIIVSNSTDHVQNALAANENINGTGDRVEWLGQLEQAYTLYQDAESLQRLTKKMRQNDPDSGLQAREIVNKTAARSVGTNFRKLTDIEPADTPFTETGWEVLDKHTGGLPTIGITIVGGSPGCLSGDTVININRAGKGFSIRIDDLVMKLNGKRKDNKKYVGWDLSIPTCVAQNVDGVVRKGILKSAWYSGMKMTYVVATPFRSIRATEIHPFLTKRGWVQLKDLQIGDEVCRNHGKEKPFEWYKKKSNYYTKMTKYHPYQLKHKRNGFDVSLHRLVYEAYLNSLSTDEFIYILNNDEQRAKTLIYLPREIVVHHKDLNTKNNSLNNLNAMTTQEHHKIHAEYTTQNVLDHIGYEPIIRIEPYKVEPTYDIEMVDIPNYLANGFVVHNSGKTAFAKILAQAFALRWPEKIVALFSVEMMGEEIAGRFKVKGSEKKDWHDRIFIDDQAFMTPEQIVSRSATIENLGMIVIDFADLLIAGGGDENKYSGMYIYLMQAAKQLKCPIVILAQFSRTYSGGIPRPHHLRYTGLAEALGWSIFTLYNPNTDYFAEQEDKLILPPIPDHAYICVWKQRGGFRQHPNDSPGAISVPFRNGKWSPTLKDCNWTFIQKSKKKG